MSNNYKKLFFDPKNFDSIVNSLNNLTSTYNYKLNNEDKKKCLNVMKYLSINNRNLQKQNIKVEQKIYLLNVNTIEIMKDYLTPKFNVNPNNKMYNMGLKNQNIKEESANKTLPNALVPQKIDNDKEIVNSNLMNILKDRESDYDNLKKEIKEEKKEDNNKLEPFGDDNLHNFNLKPENLIKQTQDSIAIKPKEKYSKMVQDIKDDRKFMSVYELIVDSKDRNYDNYPNSNNYSIELDTNYKDIVSIELVSTIVPRSQYVINSSNNTIHFNEGSDDLVATITEGNYTVSTLATALKSSMETVGGLTYTISEDTLTNKITISSSGTFSLLFNGGSETYLDGTRTIYPENSIAPVLGFTRTELSGSTSYVAQNQYNLNGENYVLLEIQDLENLQGTIIGNTTNKHFCKIMLNVDNNENKYFTNRNDYLCKKYFDPLLHKLSKLNIRFYTYYGSLYDFNGLEHSLHFRIRTLNKNNQLIDLENN